MPAKKHWVISCDAGCGASFQAHGDVSLAGIEIYLPASWLMVRWRRNRETQVRYLSSPQCLAKWATGSADAMQIGKE